MPGSGDDTDEEAAAALLDAHGVAALFAARVVQRIATGAAVGVVGAYVLDVRPGSSSRLGGLVNGATATGGVVTLLAAGALTYETVTMRR